MEHKETCGIAFAVVLARIKSSKETLDIRSEPKNPERPCSILVLVAPKIKFLELKSYATIKSKGI